MNDNPNVAEFTKNTQAIKVMNLMCHTGQFMGNCRGSGGEQPAVCSIPLPKQQHSSSDATVNQCQSITVTGMFI